MSQLDDLKEAHFSSVLPWIILYRIIKAEEAAFNSLLRQHIPAQDEEGGFLHEPVCLSVSLSVAAPPPERVLSPQTTPTGPCCPPP